MTSNEKKIFLEAIELPIAERQEFLQSECGDDPDLLNRLTKLLAVHSLSNVPVDKPAVDFDDSIFKNQPDLEKAGTRIGVYELVERIGSGGMGNVWKAARSDSIFQEVAIKVIKPGMDSELVIRRFEAERQALALMDHPNIARVLDAGMTARGRPYFVMELIDGRPITEYCKLHQLNMESRLNVFVDVCRAVHHAHLKGIIHRDVKPSNILVGNKDGQPLVKVIDFGVAKAIEGQLTGDSVHSEFFRAIGTLQYMSPEQAGIAARDVDTRSDVYSLGVVLYELLLDTTPFSEDELGNSLEESCRIIRNRPPEKPSRKYLSFDARKQLETATAFELAPKKLARKFQGDLDSILGKALEKDRNLRYQSAARLAEDVQRFLNGFPVEASTPSSMHRLRTAWAQYRAAIWTAIFVFSVLAVCLLFSLYQTYRLASAIDAKNEAVTIAKAANQSLVQDLYFSDFQAAFRDFSYGNLTKTNRFLLKYSQPANSVETGYEFRYLKRRVQQTRGEKILQHTHPIYTLSLSQNNRVVIGSEQNISLFDFSKRPQLIGSFKTKRDNSIDQTTGNKNYWSFPFASISKTGTHICYVHPDRIDTLRVREVETDKFWDLPDHAQTVRCATFLNEHKVVSGDHEGNVRIWNFEKNQIRHKSLHQGLVWDVATDPKGELVASCGTENRICIWDVAADSIRYLDGHYEVPSTTAGVYAVAFSPDSNVLASAGTDRTIRIWDLKNSKQLSVLTGHKDEVRSIAFSPDGKLLVSGGRDNSVRVWDWMSGFQVSEFFGPTYVAQSVQFANDGNSVLASSFDGGLFQWPTTQKNSELFRLEKAIADLSVSPNGMAFVAIESDSTEVHFWKLDNPNWQASQRTFALQKKVNAVAINDERIIVALLANGEIVALDGNQGKMTEMIRVSVFSESKFEGKNFHHEALNFSSDGKTLCVGSPTGEVGMYNFDTKKSNTQKVSSSPIRSVVMHDDLKLFATCTGNQLHEVNLLENKSRVLVDHARFVTIRNNTLAFSGDGPVTLLDLSNGTRSVQNTEFREVRFLNDTNLVLSTGYSTELAAGELYLWDAELNRLRCLMKAHESIVECFDTCHQAEVIVSGSLDGSIRVFYAPNADSPD